MSLGFSMGLQGEVAKCRKETGATIANNQEAEEGAPVEAEGSSIIDAVVEGCESVLHAVENAAAACVDAFTTPAVEGVEQALSNVMVSTAPTLDLTFPTKGKTAKK